MYVAIKELILAIEVNNNHGRDRILLEILAKCELIFSLASWSYIKLANFSVCFFSQSIGNPHLIPLSSISCARYKPREELRVIV